MTARSKFGEFEPYVPGPSEASYTLDRQIAEAREQMGAERWSELCAEWEIEPARVLTREQS